MSIFNLVQNHRNHFLHLTHNFTVLWCRQVLISIHSRLLKTWNFKLLCVVLFNFAKVLNQTDHSWNVLLDGQFFAPRVVLVQKCVTCAEMSLWNHSLRLWIIIISCQLNHSPEFLDGIVVLLIHCVKFAKLSMNENLVPLYFWMIQLTFFAFFNFF